MSERTGDDYCPRCYGPLCDHCDIHARWSVQNYEDTKHGDDQPVVRWFACGRHVHRALDQGQWSLDAVQVMDLAAGESRS